MSILTALAHAYEHLPDAPIPGYSSEKIAFVIGLASDGRALTCTDIRESRGKKKIPRALTVPAAFKRPGVTPRAFSLWDNSAYALGVANAEGKTPLPRWQAFREHHLQLLADTTDEGLLALKRFVETWQPEQFEQLGWPEEVKDSNVVFALEQDRIKGQYLHQRPAARALLQHAQEQTTQASGICLVSGQQQPIARLHPAIKGVWGAQSSGASIVSFNQDAFASYGHQQGANAPVSESAAFAYTTSLNHFLQTDSGHRLQIGDSSTVFWAAAEDQALANECVAMFNQFFNDAPAAADAHQATAAKANPSIAGPAEDPLLASNQRIASWLNQLRQGLPLPAIAPQLAHGVRFYVLGLAPNASRLSIRYWWENDFGVLAANYQRYVQELQLEPPPRDPYPALWKYLSELAVLGKRENVPPNLAGDWMRAILHGSAYPLTLLATVLMRLRADKNINALRVGLMKAVLIRNFKREVPVALDQQFHDKGYVLGRLFALYEHIQQAALGTRVNATIKDKYYGAASAQPRKVFALLDKGSAHHLSKIGKEKAGYRVNLEKQVAALMAVMDPAQDPFPAALSAQEQALFGLGYYHQRSDLFKPKASAETEVNAS